MSGARCLLRSPSAPSAPCALSEGAEEGAEEEGAEEGQRAGRQEAQGGWSKGR